MPPVARKTARSAPALAFSKGRPVRTVRIGHFEYFALGLVALAIVLYAVEKRYSNRNVTATSA